MTRPGVAVRQGAAAPDTVCPLCGAPVDDEDHALNACTSRKIFPMISYSHKVVLSAVEKGQHGCWPIFADIETRSAATAHRNPRQRGLPQSMRSDGPQPSCPDMILAIGPDGFTWRDGNGVRVRSGPSVARNRPWTAQDRRDFALHLVEIKYVFDLRVHELVDTAKQQHQALAASLR